jgi:hypothetical protein
MIGKVQAELTQSNPTLGKARSGRMMINLLMMVLTQSNFGLDTIVVGLWLAYERLARTLSAQVKESERREN